MTSFKELFHRNYRILKFFGIFLNEGSSRPGRWFAYAHTATSYAIHFFMVFQALYDLYLVRHDLSKIMLNACMSGLISGVLLRNLIFLKIQPEVIAMHRRLWEDGRFPRDRVTDAIFADAIVELKRITNFFVCVLAFMIPCWLAIPFVSNEGEFQLIFRGWFPFETDKYPNFYFAYLMQAYYIFYIAVSIICCDLMSYNILLLIKTHYTVLARNIRRMDFFLAGQVACRESVDDLAAVEMKDYVRDLVVHHHQILRFMSEFEDLYSPPFLIQVYGGTILIASLVFEIFIFTDEIKFNSKIVAELVLCAATAGNLFTFCLFGTVLEHTSYSISEVVYGIKWYEYHRTDSTVRTFIMLLISHSQRPHRLTAAKMTPVNFPTFLSIMEMIYNMMALFRQIANK